MLARVTAVEYVRPASAGRTSPSMIVCEKADGSTVEVVAKFSAQCDEGVKNLARESIAACLASDLSLPVPEAMLVDVPTEWAQGIVAQPHGNRIAASIPVAFGSRLITGQYSAWTSSTPIGEEMLEVAAAIFAFDGIVQNPDRRVANPNCIVRGSNVRIFDHELCFSHGVVIGWRPPWELGGLATLEKPGNHIFRSGLRRRGVDTTQIEDAWLRISDERLAQYLSALPREWSNASAIAQAAAELIAGARDNIQGCLEEIRRVLS